MERGYNSKPSQRNYGPGPAGAPRRVVVSHVDLALWHNDAFLVSVLPSIYRGAQQIQLTSCPREGRARWLRESEDDKTR